MPGCSERASTSALAMDDLPKRVKYETPDSSDDVAVEESQENHVMEQFTRRPRAMSHHLECITPPSRRRLTVQARIWRSLMRLGMRFHGWAPPRAPNPDFVHKIETDTIPIELLFYVPQDYHQARDKVPLERYPIVVNFHGGGFTMGDATDDRYFAGVVLQHTRAVFISVNYRRAPEHPFPAPVDDCVEALMWLSSHATELCLDPRKTALTGFSAGGNLSFTVPFRLTYHTDLKRPRLFPGPDSNVPSEVGTPALSRVSTTQNVKAGMNPEVNSEGDLNPRAAASTELLLKKPVSKNEHEPSNPSISPHPSPAASQSHLNKSDADEEDGNQHVRFRPSQLNPDTHPEIRADREDNYDQSQQSRPTRPKITARATTLNTDRPTNLRIVSIIAFYPLLDWTSSRSAKVRSSRKPSATLKKTFTDLFDYSYLPPPDDAEAHISPFASPGLAPTEMIRDGLPTRIQLWLCEYDMLLAEGEKFVNRLKELGKDVYSETIEGVPHGWDKSPNPFRNQKKINELYERSARELQSVFDEATEHPEELVGERIALGGLR